MRGVAGFCRGGYEKPASTLLSIQACIPAEVEQRPVRLHFDDPVRQPAHELAVVSCRFVLVEVSFFCRCKPHTRCLAHFD